MASPNSEHAKLFKKGRGKTELLHEVDEGIDLYAEAHSRAEDMNTPPSGDLGRPEAGIQRNTTSFATPAEVKTNMDTMNERPS